MTDKSNKNTTAATLEVEDLHKSFGDLEVLKGVSMTAREGDVVSIVGSSGSGKSTFLRCINLLELPTAGTIRLSGEDVKFKGSGKDPRAIGQENKSRGCALNLAWSFKASIFGSI
jgi:ABC-type histidine transport system ATPase subunit